MTDEHSRNNKQGKKRSDYKSSKKPNQDYEVTFEAKPVEKGWKDGPIATKSSSSKTSSTPSDNRPSDRDKI
jgi:hypothetical protein